MLRTRRARRYFNPHPHTEGDPDRLPNLFQLVGISTHTLARRVTRMFADCAGGDFNFNPHPRTEGDTETVRLCLHRNNFNPHPRTEGDAVTQAVKVPLNQFQPTPSHGG